MKRQRKGRAEKSYRPATIKLLPYGACLWEIALFPQERRAIPHGLRLTAARSLFLAFAAAFFLHPPLAEAPVAQGNPHAEQENHCQHSKIHFYLSAFPITAPCFLPPGWSTRAMRHTCPPPTQAPVRQMARESRPRFAQRTRKRRAPAKAKAGSPESRPRECT